MPIPFVKMHGLGNDYVYVDGTRQPMVGVDLRVLARAMSDRHRGIGGDGLILILPPRADVAADVRMEMYNADGSRGEMCGNGIRCVGRYAVQRLRLGRKEGGATRLMVETDRGVLRLDVHTSASRVTRVRVDMGRPILRPSEIPVRAEGERCVRETIEAGGRRLKMTCVSMGNPHAVFFVPDAGAVELERIGPLIERHDRFPARINAHFAQALGKGEVHMRTWERGSGATQACGTGACATLVAGVLEQRLSRQAVVHLPGGDLEVEWPDDDGPVFMTGPAEEVFEGEWRE